MEHKGVNFTVVQTSNPTGWRWTVELVPPLRSRTGETADRESAVRKARTVIDNLILASQPKPSLTWVAKEVAAEYAAGLREVIKKLPKPPLD